MGLVQATAKQVTDGAATQSYSFSGLPVVGNYVFILAGCFAGGSRHVSVTDNQGHGTYGVVDNVSGNDGASIHYMKVATSSGTFTVTLDAGGSGDYFQSAAMEWNGVAASLPFDQSAVNSGTGTSQSTGNTSATAQADELVIAVVQGPINAVDVGCSTPAAAGYSSLFVEQDGHNHGMAEGSYKVIAATGVQAASWTTTTSGPWRAVIATFKLAAAAGALLRHPGMSGRMSEMSGGCVA